MTRLALTFLLRPAARQDLPFWNPLKHLTDPRWSAMIPGHVGSLLVASTDDEQSDQGSSLSIRFLTENRENFRQQSQSFKLTFHVRLLSYPLPGTSFAVKGG